MTLSKVVEALEAQQGALNRLNRASRINGILIGLLLADWLWRELL